MPYDDVTMGDNEVSVVTYDRLLENMILCRMMMLLGDNEVIVVKYDRLLENMILCRIMMLLGG